MGHWAKLLLIGYGACWPDRLRTLADLSSNPDLEGNFQLDWTNEHAEIKLRSACVLSKL